MTPGGATRTQPAPAAGTADVRCVCHNLVARRRGRVIELKCRRCKRVLRIELTATGVTLHQT